MEYILKDKILSKVNLSENRKNVILDYTLILEGSDDGLLFPITDGMSVTIETPAGILDDIDRQVTQYLTNKYKIK